MRTQPDWVNLTIRLTTLTSVMAVLWGASLWVNRRWTTLVPDPVLGQAVAVIWFSMLVGVIASEYPKGNDYVGLRFGLATFCRTGLPLLHVLLNMFNYASEFKEAAIGYIAIYYLIGFPLSIALSLAGNQKPFSRIAEEQQPGHRDAMDAEDVFNDS